MRHTYKFLDPENLASIEVVIESKGTPGAALFDSLIGGVKSKFPGLNAEASEEGVREQTPKSKGQRMELGRPAPGSTPPDLADLGEDGEQPFGDEVQGLSQKAYAAARDDEEMRQREKQLGKGIFSTTLRKRLRHR